MKPLHLAPLVASLVACRRDPPRPPAPSTRPDASVARPDASVARPDASVARADARAAAVDASLTPAHLGLTPDAGPRGARDGGRAPRAVQVAPPAVDDLQQLVVTSSGALLVRVVARPGQRAVELVASRLDADGVAQGEPRLLRRTTGPVVSLSAHAAGEHLWVSWATDRSAGHDDTVDLERITAALHARADLSAVDAPRTLDDTRIAGTVDSIMGGWWRYGSTAVFARGDGGALVVATGGLGTCTLSYDPTGEHVERFRCGVWNEFRIDPSGHVSAQSWPTVAPYGAPEAFAEIPGGVVFAVSNEHEVRSTSFVTSAFTPGPTVTLPRVGPVFAHDDVATAWTGDGVAAIGALQLDFDEGDAGPRGFVWWDREGRPRTPDGPARGSRVAWAPYTRDPLRCVDGHPVVTVRWRGAPAGALTLDASRADQHFDLAAWAPAEGLPLPPAPSGTPRDARRVTALVWTGRALVGLVDGALTRWRCTPVGALARVP